jgi:hypothetical protein
MVIASHPWLYKQHATGHQSFRNPPKVAAIMFCLAFFLQANLSSFARELPIGTIAASILRARTPIVEAHRRRLTG